MQRVPIIFKQLLGLIGLKWSVRRAPEGNKKQECTVLFNARPGSHSAKTTDLIVQTSVCN